MGGGVDLVAAVLLVVVVGSVAGAVLWGTRRVRGVVERARRQAEETRVAAEREARRRTEAAEADRAAAADRLAEQRAELEQRERRLAERERRLDVEFRRLDEVRKREERRAARLDRRLAEVSRVERDRLAVLEAAAGLSAQEAREALVAEVTEQAEREAALVVRRMEWEARAEGAARAREIIAVAVQRLAGEQTSESAVSVVPLPREETKGRIIGRRGRNIRAFEAVTGVNLVVDERPDAVSLSCFDPVRREVARRTLERLVADGRIHPPRIEEAHAVSLAEVRRMCVRAGEEALARVGVTGVHPELVALLGRLRYRTSYGQNVLAHLVECAHLAGMMAAELGADARLVRRCALLHDIGKALTHEVAGSHAVAGARIARRYGESEEVAHAIEAHHDEVEVRTVEAVLTQAADAASGGRPGARRASAEAHVERLRRLEEIAHAEEGVAQAFAVRAGREVRVMVRPDSVDDVRAQMIARNIAKRVEEETVVVGQVRVTVIRESRAVETAR